MKITFLSVCLLTLLFTFSTQTFAVDFTVNLTTDQQDASTADGICDIDLATAGEQCSLRAAVEQANNLPSNDRVLFSLPANSTITLTIANNGEIFILNSGTLEIVGTGANNLTIDGGAGTNRIFYINLATVTISGVKLTGGNGTSLLNNGNGGAIFSTGGSLTLNSVNVTNNTAANQGGGLASRNDTISITNSTFSNNSTPIFLDLSGGAANFLDSTTSIINSTFSANSTRSGGAIVFARGTHFISGSTFSANNATLRCGGIANETATLRVFNSTISGNTVTGESAQPTSGFGGGICNSGDLTLRNVTVTSNTAVSGGGIIAQSRGTLDFGNSIVAGNIAPVGSGPEIQNTVSTTTSAGGNLIGDSSGDSGNTGFPIAYQPTDIRDTNPMLGALQNNGGTTLTHALLLGSPAIDRGLNALVPIFTDQRGFPRIVDGNGDGTAIVDIGAFEAPLGTTAASVSVSGRVTARGRGISNAVVHLTSQSGEILTSRTNRLGYYTFTDLAAGETYIFNVFSKRYQFNPQVVNLTEDLAELDFSAQ
jgi:predicted outer membrane repeat protein